MINRIAALIFLPAAFLSCRTSFSQVKVADTLLIKHYLELSVKFEKKYQNDSAFYYYEKALQLNTKYHGERNLKNADIIHLMGRLLVEMSKFDQALDYYNRSLNLRQELGGEISNDVALSYIDIGALYYEAGNYEKSLEYDFKALNIKLKLKGEKNTDVATTYNNIGLGYARMGEFDKALEYDLKALVIRKEVLGEKHRDVAASYSSIGNVYEDKGESEKALEYLLKALQLRREILGENSYYVANDFANIGNVYQGKGDDKNAVDHYLKALKIYTAILGEKHYYTALCNMNLGISYLNLNEYGKALDYDLKALDVLKQIYGEVHPHIATCCVNVSDAYYKLKDYDNSLSYQVKALKIFKEVFGEKHPYISATYNNLGSISKDKKDYEEALRYFQNGIASSLNNFNDTTEIFKIPGVKGYLNWFYLLQSLINKADIIGDQTKTLSGPDPVMRRESAIAHYLACDSLIDLVKREITTQSDKLALGEKANEVYRKAIDLLIPLNREGNTEDLNRIAERDKNLAFYFSEKSKSSVLLEAIAGQKALKYAGISDSLIRKEENLEAAAANLRKILAEPGGMDSIQIESYRDKLFRANRSIDSLILVFEKEYPSYYDLKYKYKPATVQDIQALLDRNFAMLSYFTGDTTITIFNLTRNNLDIVRVAKIPGLNDSIEFYRNGLTLGIPGIILNFGQKLYKQVFPGCLPISSRIKTLLIVPDGSLTMLPFESLLTESFSGDINMSGSFPYLIKKYNICYAYSGNLFYQESEANRQSGEDKQLNNGWLGFAPVFSSADNTLTQAGSDLQVYLKEIEKDSKLARNSILRGGNISPLPATETEVASIFKLFRDNNLKATLVLHENASEKYIKSENLAEYKILHIATHGFVNPAKPELSGLLLARDTTGGEDGVLYTGEIYNLKLNADLVVLSACETGLGKIQKGEGVMGLTRSLLYAGVRNIIVSLWPVNDYSTNDLMMDFYKNILSSKGDKSYSRSLRQAKLKMISGKKYSSPFYWSPFILIGE